MNLWSMPSEYQSHDSTSSIVPRMNAMVSDLGLEHFSFLFLNPGAHQHQPLETTLHTSYPNEWVERYTRHKYWDVDPVADLGRRSIRPFLWGQGPFLRHFAKPQKLVFEEAGVFNIKFGLTIPIRGTHGELSIFNVVSSNKTLLGDVVREAEGRLYTAAVDTHELALRSVSAGDLGARIVLSRREKECLSWTLEGKTAGEIAAILGISVSTVNQHASSASNKLGSLNKHHAAVQALRLNLIH
ncbi:MAG TPA: hypothetical protein DEF12_11865 [Rhodobacteraceae bacterium]|jgi:DNA-binding CsgD family transcriptional regulator|nr:hypothetical protein [Paracoccaceae bacterium]